MRVLLISPVAGLDPAGGDLTYTQMLASNPPDGVEYETYDQAISRGALMEHGTRQSLKNAWRSKKGVLREFLFTVIAKSVNLLKKRRVLFWEPFRFFSVRAGEYDLVHMHIFSARFLQLDCPLVVSCGGPLRYLYIDARDYSTKRARRLEKIDLFLARLLKVNDYSGYLPQASYFYTFTRSGTKEFQKRRIIDPARIGYVPFYMPSLPSTSTPPNSEYSQESRQPKRVGFVARDFNKKGGFTVLEAWKTVRSQRPDAELVIAGSPVPKDVEKYGEGITWLPYLPREELLNSLMPSFDVFVYPTLYDYLPCYTLVEVMARGIPIAGNDHRDYEEFLGDKSGLVAPKNDASALARNILELLEPHNNEVYRRGAREHFEKNYSADVVLPQVGACYRAAMEARQA
ncbi:MAG TPA: glycosyltransferase family 4 protein [Abditibacteriaceae bacterium]|jgi:glycosyltransferase involved in cell wall biosynthesis